MAHKGKRPRVHIARRDEKRLLRALDSWAESGDFVALRTRAFVFLLWDGSVRTKEALHLNVEDVVKDPSAQNIHIPLTAALRSRGPAKVKEREFALSKRTRRALTAYLQVVRRDGWLPTQRLEGPLFLSSYHHGEGKRLARGSAIHAWSAFQQAHARQCSREYQLDDVVLTGRNAYVNAGGDAESLSDHSGITRRAAAEYIQTARMSPLEVLQKLDRSR